ncbi:aldehyde dehydrogenase family protein [Haloactinomyces albus]|uniref:Aldehyde dehydrogenase (NAD+) n=1 Tax=Haloactinomyces albus TaxID=1352928 RepID=A0AAE4CPD5_9ACTN|nr:aldehyde dehydrogenase family protein [Haloactinomyces albus]MDR7301603.1 aldehyde dehydrogenase (NAD+) [Haloactinomyces albus]
MSIDQAERGTQPTLRRELFIGGSWRPSADGSTTGLTDPTTEKAFGAAAVASPTDVDAAVRAARTAFDEGPWPRLTIVERAEYLRRFADALADDIEPIAQLVMRETGLPRADSLGGTKAMITVLRYYADLADTVTLEERRVGRTGVSTLIEKRPVGVVAQIVPWNSPIVMAAFNLPAALLAGCTVVLKPSELTPLSAGYLADAAVRIGLPAGVLNVVTGPPASSEALVRHPAVNKVAFTGSTTTGRLIAEAAAPGLKHVSLELGGKAAALVLDDAPLARIVDTMVPAMMFNNGQMCLQPSRLLVPRHRQQEITDALAARFAEVVVGAPWDPDTEVGPLISRGQHDKVMGLLASAVDEGGRFVVGGGRPKDLDTGYFVEPTIITDVGPRSRVATEEIFAPVLVVIAYDDEEEAIAIVNDTEFGLNDAVYSADPDRALAMARRMDSGSVNINNGQYLDVAVPFGGVKQSGYGVELGPEGLEAYFHHRVIYLDAEPFHGLG